MRSYLDDCRITFRTTSGDILSGRVTESRMRYNEMIHYVEYDTPVQHAWRDTPSTSGIVPHANVIDVMP